MQYDGDDQDDGDSESQSFLRASCVPSTVLDALLVLIHLIF